MSDPPGAHDPRSLALALVERQRTLVLATAGAGPWAAPVYYAFRDGRFWFFSSPRARHIVDAGAAGRCAAAVFRDGDDWRDIEGLQMEGRILACEDPGEAGSAFGLYAARFPTIASFFPEGLPGVEEFAARFRSRLYAFVPERALYLNNRAGFGTRIEVQLGD